MIFLTCDITDDEYIYTITKVLVEVPAQFFDHVSILLELVLVFGEAWHADLLLLMPYLFFPHKL